MPFYFQKSVNAGPFRFNFSGSGVGVSVGVKGLRVGTGPRGHYVQAGQGGFYYRATLPRSGTHGRPSRVRENEPALLSPAQDGLVLVRSGDVEAMEDAAFADLLMEIRGKEKQPRMALVLGALASGFCLLLTVVVGPAGLLGLLGAALAFAFGAWLDSFRRVVVLFYDLDDAPDSFYARLCAAFDGLSACRAMWRLDAGRSVNDLTTWKREAGASHLVKRSRTGVAFELPSIIRCNVVPPTLKLGGRTFHFLPDVVLVRDGTGVGAVGYDTLRISHQPANFIETDGVPSDAVVSHHTWEHPNKSGGPDRRFRSNRQLPVCRYEALHLGSATGVNELLEFSKLGVVQPFADAVRAVPKNRSLDDGRLLAAPGAVAGQEAIEAKRPDVGDGKIIGFSVFAMAAVTGLLALVLPHGSFATNVPSAPAAAPANADEHAFVTSPQLNCRSGAAATSPVVHQYNRGDQINVIGHSAGWARIDAAGAECWVNERFIGSSAPSVQPSRRSYGHHRGHRHHHGPHQ